MINSLPIKERVMQKRGHCGPASLVMMLSVFGYEVTQEEIAKAAGVSNTISENGSRIDQLANAIQLLYPHMVLLAKYDATYEDIINIVTIFKLPVGIEWQGIFSDVKNGQFEEGHYSLIVGIDPESQTVEIIDPEPRSAIPGGLLPFKDLEDRWWDINEIQEYGLSGGEEECILNQHLLFVVAPSSELKQFSKLNLEPASLSMMRRHAITDSRSTNFKH